MSLDISLYVNKIESYDGGKTFNDVEEEVYDTNITHNLNKMAGAAGIYEALWRPYRLRDDYSIPNDNYESEYKYEELNIIKASEIIPIIEKGLSELKTKPEHYKKYNSPNGWGTYKHFVPFVEKYLNALKKYPDAVVKCDR